MRSKACTVDHSFHQVTHSFDFVRQFLSQEYELHDFWDDAGISGHHVPVEQLNEFETVFFFQALNSFDELAKIRSKMIWMPMYDDVTRQRAFWLRLSTLPIKVICFSEKLYKHINALGVSAIFVRYYLDPKNFKPITDFKTRRIFFWLRGNICLDVVAKIIGTNAVDSMDLRWVPDPNACISEPDDEMMKRYNINLIKGVLSREDYLSLVSRNNIFIAPRLKEGIGLSTLEALTMGQCVLAHNDSTMNEYIQDGRNGILFDAENPREVNLSHFESLAKQAHKDCLDGWIRWQGDIQRILEFIHAPSARGRSNTFSFKVNLIQVTLVDAVHKRIKKLMRLFSWRHKSIHFYSSIFVLY
jgi:hypothetical protein